jgi:spore maturation protein SpmA/spore maturation protein SpmB
MLNYIWLGLIMVAVLLGGYQGNIGAVGQAGIDKAILAVYPIGATLLAVMTLWLGLMRLAEKAGLVHRLGLALRPILRLLFPEVPADHPALGAIVLNVSANILGLNNAATPLGLRAMNELDRLNPRPGVATNAMCMLLAINTSSITLIPVTAIAFLAAAKGKSPTIIIGTSLAATAITQFCAICACKLMERTSWSRRQWEEAPFAASTTVAASESAKAGAEVAASAVATDAALPWVPGAKWILAGAAGIFLGMVVSFAFPQISYAFGWRFDRLFNLINLQVIADQNFLAVSPDFFSHLWIWRVIGALSVLVLPWLILFFPLYAALRRIPVYDEFVEGGRESVQVIFRILPYLVGMLAAVGMFSAAGGMHLITWILAPLTDLVGFPAQLVPMAVIRPFSSAAAQGLLLDLIKTNGPDNLITLTAATFYGCSETTFYVIAVYFGSVGIRKSRHAIPVGLLADTIGPIAAVIICRATLG